MKLLLILALLLGLLPLAATATGCTGWTNSTVQCFVDNRERTIPPGVYTFTAPVVLPEGIYLEGYGVTLILQGSGAFTSQAVRNIGLEGFRIQGDTTTEVNVLNFPNLTENGVLHDLYIDGFKGVAIYGGTSARENTVRNLNRSLKPAVGIYGVTLVEANYIEGVYIGGSGGRVVLGNTIAFSGHGAWYPGNNTYFAFNEVYGPGGVDADNNSGGAIIGNRFHNPEIAVTSFITYAGSRSTNLQIAHNYMEGCTLNCIEIRDAFGDGSGTLELFNITDNIIKGSLGWGIYAGRWWSISPLLDYSVITGNILSGNAKGIDAPGPHNIVQNNIIR